ncbi:MAG: malto-oligosyltrehalose trehalohydrolase, partial [Halomonas sp.]|nr:malto-oligosyltrehalose trehalohydrolase [Halomonas sp.]
MNDEISRTPFTPTYGAHLIDDTRTRFVLWAPSARTVHVEVDDQPAQPMQATAEGHYEAEVACGHGARYRYR